jgi:hypothetical protein
VEKNMSTGSPEPYEESIPDLSHIEDLLSKLQPRPTSRYYRKMKNAPWTREVINEQVNLHRAIFSNSRSVWIGIALFIITAIIGISFIPSVRVVARQIIDSFIASPNDEIEIQVTSLGTGDLLVSADPSNFPYSIETVQKQTGYPIMELHDLPPGLIMSGARFDPGYNAITILYRGQDYEIFLTQRPLNDGKDVFSIGSTAQVEIVAIGEKEGEYVLGGWKIINSSDSQLPETQAIINAIWDNTLAQSTLRWQHEGYGYELRSIGENHPSQSILIQLAIGLK